MATRRRSVNTRSAGTTRDRLRGAPRIGGSTNDSAGIRGSIHAPAAPMRPTSEATPQSVPSAIHYPQEPAARNAGSNLRNTVIFRRFGEVIRATKLRASLCYFDSYAIAPAPDLPYRHAGFGRRSGPPWSAGAEPLDHAGCLRTRRGQPQTPAEEGCAMQRIKDVPDQDDSPGAGGGCRLVYEIMDVTWASNSDHRSSEMGE